VRKCFKTSASSGFALDDAAAITVRLKNKKIIIRIAVYHAVNSRGSILKVYTLHFGGPGIGFR